MMKLLEERENALSYISKLIKVWRQQRVIGQRVWFVVVQLYTRAMVEHAHLMCSGEACPVTPSHYKRKTKRINSRPP